MPTATMLRQGAAGAGCPEPALPAAGASERLAQARPHLCFVAPHAWPVISGDASLQLVGGAEVQQAVLARLFAANGYRVSMICLDFGQPSRVEIDGVQLYRA